MYANTENKVKFPEGLSEAFKSQRGVKQGDVLSPILFNMFINGIVDKLKSSNANPVTIGNEKINCLLYADDLVLLSSCPNGLQKCLDALQDFCTSWKLEVNIDKSKVLIFNSNGKSFLNYFSYNNKTVETVNQYCYLGVILKCNGNFNLAISTLTEKARKAYFKIKRTLGLNHSCQLLEKLFDTLVKPILLYCCEIWGLDHALKGRNSESYELLHTKFVKEILGVHCRTPNAACLSELGRFPLNQYISISAFKYLKHLLEANKSLAYDILVETWTYNPWVKNLNTCCQKLGLPQFYHFIPNLNSYKLSLPHIIQRIGDITLQEQRSKVRESEKLLFFKTLTAESYARAQYVDCIKNKPERSILAKLRLSAHNLYIEKGRHLKIPKDERYCNICNSGKVEDENHFLWQCQKYDSERKIFTEKMSMHVKRLHIFDDMSKSVFLLNSDSCNILKQVSKYISSLFEIRSKAV